MYGEADREFARLAGAYLDDRAERHPDLATGLGDHRFDDQLADLSPAALGDERRALDGWAARLSALDAGALSAEHQVDAAMMADSVARRAPSNGSPSPLLSLHPTCATSENMRRTATPWGRQYTTEPTRHAI
jgi:uncharacterized protein (DUF885 family)